MVYFIATCLQNPSINKRAPNINYVMLKRNFRLNLSPYDFIIKPIVVTIIMSVTAYYAYGYIFVMTQNNVVAVMVTVITSAAIFGFVILHFAGVSAKDISLLPFGENISNTLIRLKTIKVILQRKMLK